jgi:hypothetical protein
MVDVSTEVAEPLLIVSELFEKFIGHLVAKFAHLDRLFGEALLEVDHFAPRGRSGVPNGGRAFECAVLVQECVAESRLSRDTAHCGLEFSGDEFENR